MLNEGLVAYTLIWLVIHKDDRSATKISVTVTSICW